MLSQPMLYPLGKIYSALSDYVAILEKEKMKKEMEAEIRAQLALNQEAMQSWDEKVSLCCQIIIYIMKYMLLVKIYQSYTYTKC